MGEIADAMLEGLFDEETGELIDGDAPGYPRRMSDAQHDRHPTAAKKPKRTIKCPGCMRHFATPRALRHHLKSVRAKCKAKPEKTNG